MDAFKLHQQVIDNYRSYIKSFLNIKDKRIKDFVETAFKESGFIPEPLIQFNPSFDKGEKLEDLVRDGKIHRELPAIFGDYNLFKHQVEALKIGIQGKGFVVTSGTGSGKSLIFLATIFNKLLENQNNKKKGVKAILVYPMNALINSQEEEIKKYEVNYLLGKCPGTIIPVEKVSLDDKIEFLKTKTHERFPVTYAKYSGQENVESRKKIEKEKPDIILTNYMMLELIMTRQSEHWMRESLSSNLQFLVFDELHTYRGRQGSDVSLLIRRIKNIAKNNIVSIGTSATMASGGTKQEKQQAVADVAETIFGDKFDLSQIIGEYLVTCTNPNKKFPNEWELQEAISKGINIDDSEDIFYDHPVAIWLENKIALHHLDDRFIERGLPKKFSEIVTELQKDSGSPHGKVAETVKNALLWAEKLNYKAASQAVRKSYLPFRFHQFISQTNTVYVTLDPIKERAISIKSGRYVKDKDKQNGDKFIYPVLFSRYSGHEFVCVSKNFATGTFDPRDPSEALQTLSYTEAKKNIITEQDFAEGYLIIPQDEDDVIWSDENEDDLPESWWKENKSGRKLIDFYRFQIPHKIYFNKLGEFSNEPIYDQWGWFISAKLRIDPTAGVVYEDSKTGEYTKLMRLGNEGRSTATTIMSYSVIDSLNQQGEELRNQKLLSFTDNRQDASLQAGHFNDFLTTVRLRSGVYYALKDAPDGLKAYDIAQRTCEKLQSKGD